MHNSAISFFMALIKQDVLSILIEPSVIYCALDNYPIRLNREF